MRFEQTQRLDGDFGSKHSCLPGALRRGIRSCHVIITRHSLLSEANYPSLPVSLRLSTFPSSCSAFEYAPATSAVVPLHEAILPTFPEILSAVLDMIAPASAPILRLLFTVGGSWISSIFFNSAAPVSLSVDLCSPLRLGSCYRRSSNARWRLTFWQIAAVVSSIDLSLETV